MRSDRLLRLGADLEGLRGQQALDRLLETAIEMLSMAGASIAVVSDGSHLGSLAMAGMAQPVDELQFTLGEGPCISADGNPGPLLEPDLYDALAIWPAFAPAASRLGIRGIFSFPLRVGPVQLGVLTYYRIEQADLIAEDLADALAIGHIASHLLLDFEEELIPGLLPRHLEEIVDLRRNVHQATGMLAAQLDCDIATALGRLRAHAWSLDRPIGDIADDIVARRLRFDPV